jgi:hypothetical protein
MKSILKPVTAFLLFFLFIYSAMFTTSCNQKLTKEDSLAICNKVMLIQNCCSIALDCKGLTGFVGTHLYSPFIAEGQKGEIGVIIPIESDEKFRSYVLVDSNSTSKNIVKIIKLNKAKPTQNAGSVKSPSSYHTLSIKVNDDEWETFELIVETIDETTGTEIKKGRGKIIRSTTIDIRDSDTEEKESEDKK